MSVPEIPQAELSKLIVDRPHVVLLGAGASRAAFPDGDRNGVKLPLMCDLVEMLGLDKIFERSGIDYAGRNFEVVYGDLCKQPELNQAREKVEERIRDYFGSMELPDPPTIYDHLVLSLREKDLIATFNWDPFLFQAGVRHCGFARLPRMMFLHGNVAIGYCATDKVKGPTESCVTSAAVHMSLRPSCIQSARRTIQPIPSSAANGQACNRRCVARSCSQFSAMVLHSPTWKRSSY